MRSAAQPVGSTPGKKEFVFLIAALMAGNALGIDSMLPALPAIGESLGVTDENRRQLVITFYMLGFGGAQIAYGPLADRFGRKRLLIGAMVCYAAFATLCGLASSFVLLLAARTLQGIAAAGGRVLVVAVVRDRFEGAAMAQVMSTAMIVFMLAPVLAPSLGQAMLTFASWRYIFLALALYGLILAVWGGLRMPETLAREARRPLSVGHIGAALAETVSHRVSLGNTAAMTMTFGALLGYIGSVQQVVFDVFHRPALLGVTFACVALPMALSSWLNSRLVMRFGSRRLLLAALAMFTATAALHLLVRLTFGETIWLFVALQALTMGCFGLIGSNAGALAMEPLGHIAGTASAAQGLVSTIGAALIGLLVGQMFDGTTVPLITGFVLCGGCGLALAWWANAGLPAHCRGEEEAVSGQPLG